VTDGRKYFSRALATLCITAGAGTVLVAPAAQAQPDITTTQQQVDRLSHQADQASGRYDVAQQDMSQARTRLARLRADLDRQEAKVARTRNRVAASAAPHTFESDPDALITQLSTVKAFNDQQRHVTTSLNLASRRLHEQQAATRQRMVRIAVTRQRLAADKSRAESRASKAAQLLQTLKDRAEAQASRSSDRTAVATSGRVAASGRAAAAGHYAVAQVGKSYGYGAAGPSAFDCSGLTMMAWAQAGVALPHSSSGQTGSGTSVSQSQLQPGDLVFYYSPVSHVGIYIGNGQIVNALNPGAGVRISALNSMPYSGAVRPG
jgi:cell wall-associated NlpC family hydrolase